MNALRLVKLISAYRIPAARDSELKEGIAMLLRENGVPFLREFELSERDHIDFLCGTIGIECKVAGSALALAQQVARFQEAPEISTLLLVVTNQRLTAIERWVPSSFTKPMHTLLMRA